MTDLAIKLAEKLNIPIAADLLSKSAVPENHPLYLGVYGGAMSSDEHVREYVESADCVLMLGTFITDMNMGIYTAKLDRKRTILATTERVNVRITTTRSVRVPRFSRVHSRRRTIKPKTLQTSQPARRSHAAEEERADRSAHHGRCHAHRFAASRRDIAAWSRCGRRDFRRRRHPHCAPGAVHRAGVLPVDGLRRAREHRRRHGQARAPPVRRSSATARFR